MSKIGQVLKKMYVSYYLKDGRYRVLSTTWYFELAKYDLELQLDKKIELKRTIEPEDERKKAEWIYFNETTQLIEAFVYMTEEYFDV